MPAATIVGENKLSRQTKKFKPFNTTAEKLGLLTLEIEYISILKVLNYLHIKYYIEYDLRFLI